MSSYLFAQHGDVAFLIEDCTDGVFLYSVSHEFIGDTWHRCIEEAKAQASFDLRGISGPWRAVDEEFALELKTGKTRS